MGQGEAISGEHAGGRRGRGRATPQRSALQKFASPGHSRQQLLYVLISPRPVSH